MLLHLCSKSQNSSCKSEYTVTVFDEFIILVENQNPQDIWLHNLKKMNIIKQILAGHKNSISVRKMAEMYSMSPTTVQRYLKMASEDPLGIDLLLRLEDPELNHRFNGGNPAYCDKRFEDFKTRIAYFEKELEKPNVTTYFETASLWSDAVPLSFETEYSGD